MNREWVCCRDEAASHQLPIAAAFWIIQIASVEEYSSLTQNWVHICCSINSVILNATATQDTCSLNGAYCPHWLVRRSHHCSHMCIPVHSPWLLGYIGIAQTILIILTMSGLFLDRPPITLMCTSTSCYWGYYYQPHFIDEETDSEGFGTLATIILLKNCRDIHVAVWF